MTAEDGTTDVQDEPTEAAVLRCEPAQAALDFLTNLRLSAGARVAADASAGGARFECEGCGKATRLYCTRCLRSSLPLPPPLSLGLQVLVLRHPKEPAAKSSAAPLPMLASDVEVREWSPSLPEHDGDGTDAPSAPLAPGTWLVYPTASAAEASEVNWTEVTGL
ncbi:unnamed protein product, partial [Polarella glacialis]